MTPQFDDRGKLAGQSPRPGPKCIRLFPCLLLQLLHGFDTRGKFLQCRLNEPDQGSSCERAFRYKC